MIGALLGSAIAQAIPPCDIAYPVAGSAGFDNAQAARITNRNTYGAAAFAERVMADEGPVGRIAMEVNTTMNAARVPMLCGDNDYLSTDKAYLYEQSLDLYAMNVLFSFETRSVGAFYSASVTQSIVGLRALAVPAALLQLYPVMTAPLVGVWQRGDGVSSYSLDWIGGAHVDTQWFAARAGYTGIGGLYGSVEERTLGLFASTAVPLEEEQGVTPWTFLSSGLDRLDLGQVGMEEVGQVVGMTSLYFRDLPFGEEADVSNQASESEAVSVRAGAQRLPIAVDDAATSAEGAADTRLRTLHFEQEDILERVDVRFSYALAPKPQVFDGMVAFHSPDYHRGHLVDPEEMSLEQGAGYYVSAGAVQIPPQYSLGVEGGTFFAARAEVRATGGLYVLALFNDPEQLALYPFATNALSVRLKWVGEFDR